MIFATKYDRMEDHLTYTSDPGIEEEIIYDYKIDAKSGVKSLVPVGKTSIKDFIQSHKDSVDLNKLMERFKNGEVDVFNKREAFYADVSDVPTTYPEMFARVQEAENMFMLLDPEIRAQFNNSASEFWAQYGTEEFSKVFDKKLEEFADIVKDVPTDTVKESEVVE